MKLVKTSIARRPGNGGFASQLEFKRAILAESEGVVRKIDAMDPAKYNNLPINVKLVINTHRQRVVKYTREIAELEAQQTPQATPVPDLGANSVAAHIDPQPPQPPLPASGDAASDLACLQPDAVQAEHSSQPCGQPPENKPEDDGQEPATLCLVGTDAEPREQAVEPVKSAAEAGDGHNAPDEGRGTWEEREARIEEARESLGVWQALLGLEGWNLRGWKRHPEVAAGTSFARNRRWRHGLHRGTVVDLFMFSLGDKDELSAANHILELVDEYPPEARLALRPDYDAEAQHDRASAGTSNGASAANVSVALPEIEDASDFLAKSPPRPPELVEGLLYQGSKLILSGSSKAFKTWALLDLGLSVAHGRDWLGFATQQGAVLYLNLEIQDAFFGERIRTVAEAKSIVIERGQFSVMNLRGCAADLSELLPGLLASISTRRYALIIVDPIYKVLGGRDENNAGQITELLNDLERLAVATGAAVVFAAHYSKGSQAGKSSIDRMSGSGVFARDVDAILALTQHEEADAFTVEATLRNHPPIVPFVVRWKQPLLKRDEALNPRKLKQVAGRPRAHTAEDLLGVLGDQELSFSVWKAAAKKTGISETTFKALRKELKDAGRICQCEEKGTYRKTEKGEKTD